MTPGWPPYSRLSRASSRAHGHGTAVTPVQRRGHGAGPRGKIRMLACTGASLQAAGGGDRDGRRTPVAEPLRRWPKPAAAVLKGAPPPA